MSPGTSTPQALLQTTPLNDVHRALGARMVDFGGWDMPLHYGSQIEEHLAVRRDCAMFDVSHMCILDLEGEQVRPFLRLLLANDIDKLQTPGKALYGCMLNAHGFIIDDLIVYFINEHWFRLVLNAATASTDMAWIREQNRASNSGLHITGRRDGATALALIAIQGPDARKKTWQVLPETKASTQAMAPFNAVIVNSAAYGEVMLARTGYTGEDGFELACTASACAALWQALLSADVKPAGLGARDTLRLEAGLNLNGQDMDETVNPFEAGLAWTVELAGAREFIGKRALLAMGQRHQLLGLILRQKGGVLRAHQTVWPDSGRAGGAEPGVENGSELGHITSGTFSPTMQQSIALARLSNSVTIGATVQVGMRGKLFSATVVKPPFVRKGTILQS